MASMTQNPETKLRLPALPISEIVAGIKMGFQAGNGLQECRFRLLLLKEVSNGRAGPAGRKVTFVEHSPRADGCSGGAGELLANEANDAEAPGGGEL